MGRLIVEEEQKGEERAAYGKRSLQRLSNDLTKRYGRGFSTDNFEAMRKFYLIYSGLAGRFPRHCLGNW
nr:DUF1016 family protein [Desulfobacterales bacterium]